METKTCKTCNEVKPTNDFMPRKLWCRACWNIKRANDRIKKKEIQELEFEDDTKQCTACNEHKIMSEFKVDGNQCKDCLNEKKRNQKARKKEKGIASGEIKAPPKVSSKEDHKICRICDEEKEDTEFRKGRFKCLECERDNGRTYRKSDHGQTKSAKWLEDNQEQMTKLQAEWYQNNKDHINEKYNERYHNDPEFKFKKCTQIRIIIALKNAGTQKQDRTIAYLGCKINKFKNWLEYNFDENMTLENHGEYWHMDHVVPVNTFDLLDNDQALLCFNWKNVTPLKGSENMSKHDSIQKDQIAKHMQNLLKYKKEVKPSKNKKDKVDFDEYLQLCATHLVAGTS